MHRQRLTVRWVGRTLTNVSVSKGKPAADAYLASLHSSDNPAMKSSTKGHALSVAQLERMMSHKTGPDTLANIYARLSLQWERNKPGTLQQLSVSYARATQGMGNARYAARLNQRFAAGNGRGWAAVAKQAGRLGRLMLENNMRKDRPRFTAGVDRLINDAENIVRTEMRKIEQEQSVPQHPFGDLRALDWARNHEKQGTNDKGE